MSKRKPYRSNDRSGQNRPNEQKKPAPQDIPEATVIPRSGGLTYDPDNTLAGGLYAMTPKEAVALGVALCAAVEGAVGADGCHRGVWPGNITAADGKVALGPVNDAGISEMDPDVLEFISPEQFWSGKSSPASDVYSIGLVLYTALNRGVKPYFEFTEDEPDAEQRATALEQRMRGQPLPYPATASRELGDLVLKAVAYQASERFATPGKLKAALESLPEGGLVPAVAPVVPMSEEELKNAHSYKVDKDFEPAGAEKTKKDKKQKPDTDEVDENMPAEEFRSRNAEKPRPALWLIPALVIVAAVIVILILDGRGKEPLPIAHESQTPFSQETDLPKTTASPPANETDPPRETNVPEETDTPEETNAPEETDPPEETPPEETDAPQITDGRNWSGVILADVTWSEAKALCEAEGGHLATLESDEDFAAAVERAKTAGAQFVWLGSYRDQDGLWYNVTGEQLGYVLWDAGKPAGADYLMLWYRPAAGVWSCTDQIDDPLTALPAAYGGRIGYICAYD